MFTLKKSSSSKSQSAAVAVIDPAERIALFGALFFLAFGVGLIVDGNKLFERQSKWAQRVDYKATLNPFNQ